MVMERLGEDVQTIFERQERKFNKETVLHIGIQVVGIKPQSKPGMGINGPF